MSEKTDKPSIGEAFTQMVERCADGTLKSRDTEKPSATELLKHIDTPEGKDAFWLAVRRVYCEKPWPHDPEYEGRGGVYHVCANECGAERYKVNGTWFGDDGNPMPHCPVPPALTEEPEVVARRLKQNVIKAGKADLMELKMVIIRSGSLAAFHAGADADTERTLRWWIRESTPEQQIAVCCVALDEWRI